MGRLLRLAFLSAAFALATVPAVCAANTAASVRALLSASAAAWNRHDLERFMRSYANSPSTTLVGSQAVIHGYDNIRAHYASAYRGAAMGTLSFSDLSVRPLGRQYALVVARWHLALPKGRAASGLFTLVLQQTPDGWHIVADHSP